MTVLIITKKQLIKGMFAAFAFAMMTYGCHVSAETYTVKAGDTLSQLAQTYKTTVSDLVKLNQLDNADVIYVGQSLELGAAEKQENSSVTAVSETAQDQASTSYVSQLSAADAAAKETIAFKESGGSYTAQNGQYYGRYQLTLSYLNGDLSPENQERVADTYVKNRYGSWTAALSFWQANGWY